MLVANVDDRKSGDEEGPDIGNPQSQGTSRSALGRPIAIPFGGRVAVNQTFGDSASFLRNHCNTVLYTTTTTSPFSGLTAIALYSGVVKWTVRLL